jgi:class 3 adenylate cyclase
VRTALRTLRIQCTLLLLWEQLVMRGSIALGPVFHDRQVVVGPALNRAVALERSACYPRILVDESARSLVGADVRLDHADGLPFLNFWMPGTDPSVRENSQRKALKIAQGMADTYKDRPRVAAKYVWLVQYLKSFG